MWLLLNSALVIGIGVLMLPILRPHNKNIALGYFAARVFEGIILAVGVCVDDHEAQSGVPEAHPCR